MTELLEGPTMNHTGSQPGGRHSDYQHQTWTFHNTIGLVFMSVLAFVLLVALLRQQARYREFVAQWMQQK